MSPLGRLMYIMERVSELCCPPRNRATASPPLLLILYIYSLSNLRAPFIRTIARLASRRHRSFECSCTCMETGDAHAENTGQKKAQAAESTGRQEHQIHKQEGTRLGCDVHDVADARGLRKGKAVQAARQQVPAAPDAAARYVRTLLHPTHHLRRTHMTPYLILFASSVLHNF